jgi:hypothetical protein
VSEYYVVTEEPHTHPAPVASVCDSINNKVSPLLILKVKNMAMTYSDCAEFFREEDTDVVIYTGGIARDGYEKLCSIFCTERRSKLLLVLSTYGGDPNAGYRIARAALHHYGSENFRILIPTFCKSAGTLICIGADSLIMADQAELGPLDVQLRKQDELFQQSSGLDILRGVTYLQDEALQSFKAYLLDINGGSGLSTKVASEISSKLVIGLYEPLFAQVDPVKLGEMNAALQIARHYGERLNESSSSMQGDSLNKLIMGYPTHGFVIDRSEARTLFRQVEKPNEAEATLCKFVRDSPLARSIASSSAIVVEFTKLFPSPEPEKEPDEPTSNPPGSSDTSPVDTSTELQPTSADDGSQRDHEQEQPPVGSEQNHANGNEAVEK